MNIDIARDAFAMGKEPEGEKKTVQSMPPNTLHTEFLLASVQGNLSAVEKFLKNPQISSKINNIQDKVSNRVSEYIEVYV